MHVSDLKGYIVIEEGTRQKHKHGTPLTVGRCYMLHMSQNTMTLRISHRHCVTSGGYVKGPEKRETCQSLSLPVVPTLSFAYLPVLARQLVHPEELRSTQRAALQQPYRQRQQDQPPASQSPEQSPPTEDRRVPTLGGPVPAAPARARPTSHVLSDWLHIIVIVACTERYSPAMGDGLVDAAYFVVCLDCVDGGPRVLDRRSSSLALGVVLGRCHLPSSPSPQSFQPLTGTWNCSYNRAPRWQLQLAMLLADTSTRELTAHEKRETERG